MVMDQAMSYVDRAISHPGDGAGVKKAPGFTVTVTAGPSHRKGGRNRPKTL